MGIAWVADRPGDIAITWMGYRIETSVLVAAVALLVLVIAAIILWSIVRGILRSPRTGVAVLPPPSRHERLSRHLARLDRDRRRRSARRAQICRRGGPARRRVIRLRLLLSAQSAQMAGDRGAAESASAPWRREETRLLGLRGLYIEAQRRNDAARRAPPLKKRRKSAARRSLGGEAVLDYPLRRADWARRARRAGADEASLEKADYRRKRAVLLTARALAIDESDREASRAVVLEAVKLAPDLVPAAALAGKRLAEAGEMRKARKNSGGGVDRQSASRHCRDLCQLALRRQRARAPGAHARNSPKKCRATSKARWRWRAPRLKRANLRRPARRLPSHLVGADAARRHVDGRNRGGRARRQGRVREWMGRAMRASGDPVWTADGVVSDRWLPVTPSGRLDGSNGSCRWRKSASAGR